MADDLVLLSVDILVKREDVEALQETMRDELGNFDYPAELISTRITQPNPATFELDDVIEWAEANGITLP